MSEKPVLGRGLDALIPEGLLDDLGSSASEDPNAYVRELPLAKIRPNKFQPRKNDDDEALQTLVQSMRSEGLLQPVVVRTADDGYELIAGERRCRAARVLQWKTIPAALHEVSDSQALLLALIENVQREDLNPIEEAQGYSVLISQFSLSQEQIAERVGKSRSAVANSLRLLKLPASVQDHLKARHTAAGHARALLAAPTSLRQGLCELIVAKGLSVREAEHLCGKAPLGPQLRTRQTRGRLERYQELERTLAGKFAAETNVYVGKGHTGYVKLCFSSEEEFDRLCALLLS